MAVEHCHTIPVPEMAGEQERRIGDVAGVDGEHSRGPGIARKKRKNTGAGPQIEDDVAGRNQSAQRVPIGERSAGVGE
jgi:hypothetical protein